MPLTSETQAILKLREGAPAMHTLSVEDARAASAAGRIQPETPEAVTRVEDLTIPGPAAEIPVRLYSPDPDAQLPTVVYFHGGGWVVGDLDSHDPLCRALANRANVVVLSVHYRLAPEHKYPAAADDSYAAAQWVSEHGAEIGADGSRIVVCGDSAGGNLSAVVSLMARDRGGPDLRGQVLIYPVTNLDFGTEVVSRQRRRLEGAVGRRDALVLAALRPHAVGRLRAVRLAATRRHDRGPATRAGDHR